MISTLQVNDFWFEKLYPLNPIYLYDCIHKFPYRVIITLDLNKSVCHLKEERTLNLAHHHLVSLFPCQIPME